ncbi:3-oxo-5-alpha-steroid 4-dehydrogenase 1-like [Momordica charantia]|uniref:3-oxo-5-alpha-steroid 4-dehydrogenase 1-like n=1 Tax=Momordica charantia TaxID=3673 RepID=A0A6J1D974_MOMCH|nr:3-oxo-5-alpha-steroid 4-dehydrogenase 1-like [Momordica charantia]
MAMNALSEFLFPAPPSLFVNVMTVVSSAVVTAIGISEAKGKHLQYSKFWNTNTAPKSSSEQFKISSRLGMLFLYTPAFIAGAVSLWFFPNEDRRILLIKSALTLHFFKRDLEVLFVHKYSSKMVLDSAILISLSYFSSTAIMIYSQHLSQGLPQPPIDLKNIGIALFLTGIIGNLYHHLILANTRKGGETGYKIPKGGLFGIIICPHYLFEIIVYFGFAFISQTIYALCFALATAVYLGGRSYATRRWYASKFDNFPNHVKALIPFLF